MRRLVLHPREGHHLLLLWLHVLWLCLLWRYLLYYGPTYYGATCYGATCARGITFSLRVGAVRLE